MHVGSSANLFSPMNWRL
uniref:Uncharacterized protein n=1 Tax=Rhizophora mucronata TaxID=61149 RepID=A0A2P2QJR0_RHIMU